MKKVLVSTVLLAAISASSVFAQKTMTTPAKEKEQNIIIRKKGDKNEKTTIVIDGDKVTINGKPVEDYKNDDIQIIQNEDSDMDFPEPPAAPLPPMPPRGGSKMFFRNFSNMQNSAFLGVYSSSDEDGAMVNSVTKNSPAEKAGLQKGDVITKVDNDNIDNADDLIESVGKYKPNDKVVVTYTRNKKENTITVTLEKNKDQSFSWNNDSNHISMNGLRNFAFSWNNDQPHLGLRVQDTEKSNGVTVLGVNDDESPAAKSGLKENDIITQINSKNVQSVQDVKEAMASIKAGDDVTICYLRNGLAKTVTAHFPKALQTSDL